MDRVVHSGFSRSSDINSSVLFLVFFFIQTKAYADIVRCVDSMGKTTYQEAPCPNSSESTRMNVETSHTPSSGSQKAPPNSTQPFLQKKTESSSGGKTYEEVKYRCGTRIYTFTDTPAGTTSYMFDPEGMSAAYDTLMGGFMDSKANKNLEEWQKKKKISVTSKEHAEQLTRQRKCRVISRKKLP